MALERIIENDLVLDTEVQRATLYDLTTSIASNDNIG